MAKLKILLDSSVINHFCSPDLDWDKTKYGSVLLEYSKEIIEVYAIPENVMEIALHPEHGKRRVMAAALDNVISGTRMHYSWEVAVTLNLFEMMRQHWPQAISDIAIERLKKSAARTLYGYMSLLAHLALYEDYPMETFEPILRPKVETTYIQSCFVKEPDQLIEKYLGQLKSRTVDGEDAFQEQLTSLKDKSLEEIRQMTDENMEGAQRTRKLINSCRRSKN